MELVLLFGNRIFMPTSISINGQNLKIYSHTFQLKIPVVFSKNIMPTDIRVSAPVKS
jgi:uncharacterized membrane protein YqiK